MVTQANNIPTIVIRLGLLLLAGLGLVAWQSIVGAGHNEVSAEDCPQPRFTIKAPADLYNRINPVEANRRNRRAGRELYEELSDPSCVVCHGEVGDGRGQLASQFDPPPRNFACADTVQGIPDGQLHWIILNGSPGTAMPSFEYLSDEEIWQLVIYLRTLSGHD